MRYRLPLLMAKREKLKRFSAKEAVCKECERLLDWPLVSFEKSRIGDREIAIVHFNEKGDEERYEIHMLLSHGLEK